MSSNDITFVQSFVKIGQIVKKNCSEDTRLHITGDLINLLFFTSVMLNMKERITGRDTEACHIYPLPL